jgi:hypothetical protein
VRSETPAGVALRFPANVARCGVEQIRKLLAPLRTQMPLRQQWLRRPAQLSFCVEQRRHCAAVIADPIEARRQFIVEAPAFASRILRKMAAQKFDGFFDLTYAKQNVCMRARHPRVAGVSTQCLAREIFRFDNTALSIEHFNEHPPNGCLLRLTLECSSEKLRCSAKISDGE